MGLSTIQWTDYSWNGWIGCRRVAPECMHCYAETLDRNRYSKTLDGATKEHPISHWGSGPRHRTSESNWKQPLKWNREARNGSFRECAICGRREHRKWDGIGLVCCSNPNCISLPETESEPVRPRVFCASLSDWLDDENVPLEWLADLLAMIYATPNLDWLNLTKRPQNWRKRLQGVVGLSCVTGCQQDDPHGMGGWVANRWLHGSAPANVWIGVSAGADQAAALDIPARVHFLSCEPMLRPLDTTHAALFDWIIYGGESGGKARRCNLKWIRGGVKFCCENGVSPFVKQLGGNLSDEDLEECSRLSGRSMHDSHGGDMDEWPNDLRVREFPTV